MLCDLLKGYFYHEIFLIIRMLHSASVVGEYVLETEILGFEIIKGFLKCSLLCNWTDSLSFHLMALNKSKFS